MVNANSVGLFKLIIELFMLSSLFCWKSCPTPILCPTLHVTAFMLVIFLPHLRLQPLDLPQHIISAQQPLGHQDVDQRLHGHNIAVQGLLKGVALITDLRFASLHTTFLCSTPFGI